MEVDEPELEEIGQVAGKVDDKGHIHKIIKP